MLNNMTRQMKYLLIGSTLFFYYFSAFGQQSNGSTALTTRTDSLLNLLKAAKEDTNKVNILYHLSEECVEEDVLKYAELAMQLAEKLNYKKGIAGASNNIGFVYANKGQIEKALEYFMKSLKIREEIGDKQGTAASLNNIGYIYHEQGQIAKALEYDMKALKIREELERSASPAEMRELKLGIANSLTNIGYIYKEQARLEKALEYFMKSLEIQEELERSASPAEMRELKQGIAYSLSNIGAIYKDQGQTEKALEHFMKSLKIFEEIRYKQGIAYSLNIIGALKFKQMDYEEAEKYCFRSLQMAREIGYPVLIRNASEILSKVYKAQNNYARAYEMQVLFKQMADSINNQATQQASVKKQMQYEFEKKEAVANAEHRSEMEKQNAAAEEKSRRQKIITWSIAGGLFLVIVFAGFIFRSLRETRKQKVIIEKQKQLVEKSNHEKELLLKEVHHRVKNNLQVVSSLLSLQAHNVTDPSTLEMLNQGQTRVRSMTLVHQKLYQTGNFSGIDFGDYLEQLISYISEMYHDRPGEILCSVSTSVKHFNIDTATPLGLIITELLSNSYKYAFKNKKDGKINISITAAGSNKFLLVYSDNGIGLPAGLVIENASTLGLELVTMLTKQLSGTVKTFNRDGAVFEIYFKAVEDLH
jgi:two-component sensor histidine kinase